jgi:hypothetical protein
MVFSKLKDKYNDEYGEGHEHCRRRSEMSRNMFSEIKITITCNTKITFIMWLCDALIKDGRIVETSTFAVSSGSTNNNKTCFIPLGTKSIICHPLRQSPSRVR